MYRRSCRDRYLWDSNLSSVNKLPKADILSNAASICIRLLRQEVQTLAERTTEPHSNLSTLSWRKSVYQTGYYYLHDTKQLTYGCWCFITKYIRLIIRLATLMIALPGFIFLQYSTYAAERTGSFRTAIHADSTISQRNCAWRLTVRLPVPSCSPLE